MFDIFKSFRNRKTGLVLGSGGAKGLAHISVIEYVEGMGIPVDLIAGSSIGAVVGAVYCSGGLKELKEDMLSFNGKELLSLFDLTLPRSGLLKGNDFIGFLEKYISPETMIEDYKIPLAIVATDYYTGKPVVFRKGKVLDALRASISIPGIFVPVAYKDTFLIDGGVANPLPIDVARMMGAGFTIAVNLHPGLKVTGIKKYIRSRAENLGISVFSDDIHFVEDIEKVEIPEEKKRSGWYKTVEQWLGFDQKDSAKYPSIFEILSQTIDIMEYVNTMNTLLYNRPTVLIEPDLLDIGTLEFGEAYKIMTEGYSAANRSKKALLRKIRKRI